jgi:hypothetical protein
MSSSTQDGIKRVAQLSPSWMYDIEDIDSRNTPRNGGVIRFSHYLRV